MATKSATAHAAKRKEPKAKGGKTKPAARLKKAARPAKAKVSAAGGREWCEAWQVRDKRFVELFGPATPKGGVLGPEGECSCAKARNNKELYVGQYGPRIGRVGWLYTTHGLSVQSVAGSTRKTRQELLLNWADRDAKIACQILKFFSQTMLDSGAPLTVGQLFPPEACTTLKSSGFAAWLVGPGGLPGIDRFADEPYGNVFLSLQGVTEAEYQFAQKVRADLADGRIVLLHALQLANVFPVSDVNRSCLTRRGDFNRIWENAFRIARELRAKAGQNPAQ